MDDKIKIIDYFSRIRFVAPTEDDKKLYNDVRINLFKLIDKYNIHAVINNYIYLPLYENGFRLNKSLRIKVDGPIYKKLLELHDGELPRNLSLIEGEQLDNNEIY